MTMILLTVSVGCNLWFLFLLLYDRIMETRLVRFLRSIAGLWRSLGGTAAKPETARVTPPAETPADIIGKSRFRMASTRTTAAIPTQEAATSEKGIEQRERAAKVFTDMEGTELYEKLMTGSSEMSIRIKGLIEIRLKKPKKDFVVPDNIEDFDIRNYV